MTKILAIISLLFVFTATAEAGVYIEPYLGYNAGKLEATIDTAAPDVNISDGLTGMVFGLRAGYQLSVLWVAADYSIGNGLKAALDSQAGGNTDVNVSRLAVVVGTDLPLVPLDIFGGYVLNAKLDIDESGQPSFSGSGIKAGVRFTMLPLVAINLEYLMLTYDDEDITGGSFTDVKDTALMASVSLPWEF